MNKLQAVLISHDKINLAPVGAEICGQESEALASQVFLGRSLAQPPHLQVGRQWFAIEPGGDALEEGMHGPFQD